MKKRMMIMLIGLGVLFGAIFIYKVIGFFIMRHYMQANQSPIVTVGAMRAGDSLWQPQLKSVGSLRAIKGVNVTTELAGMVQKIYFSPGAAVKEGTVLVQLNADAEIGQLQALTASAKLADITYTRDKAQFTIHAVSKQTLDADAANVKNLLGQVAQQTATVAKKTIRAPFNGRLGINLVNPGQYLNPGDTVTMLQSLDPIYVDFYLPQQTVSQLKHGQNISLTLDAYPNKIFKGKITTINPGVEVSTRNLQIEATLTNTTGELIPGMFATVQVDISKSKHYITLPLTAVSFNPYGEIVFILKEEKDQEGKKVLKAYQTFVTTGDTRGDQVIITKGVKKGDLVVVSGQLKLKNGSVVTIDNSILPPNNPNPHVENES